MKIIIFGFILLIFILSGCSNDNPVNKNEEQTNSTYVKVGSAESGSIKFEVWSATAGSLRFGYNKIGFKVFENNQPKSSGFIKFMPKMYHNGANMHSSPVRTQYDYDNSLELFTGYAIFTMPTDPSSIWYGFYNYNNQLNLDSSVFEVVNFSSSQILTFLDGQSGNTYQLTLLKPYSPDQGYNTIQCMLHETMNSTSFNQINDAHIYIMPWMVSMGHGSTGNIHPVYTSEGIYEGTVNLNMPGEWSVYDTVYYQNRKITPVVPPKFTFNP
jgi:hypothetical protein